jgi:hypothetical protein
MTTAPAKETAKEPAQTSPLRIGILLGVLVLVLGLLGYDYLVAGPATVNADKAVEKLSTDRNAKGVVKDGKIDANLVKPADVQTLLKKKPSSTKTEKDYFVEYYWWGGMPHRNFISVLYYGTGDNLRYNTHYLNKSPDKDDLPGAILADPEPGPPSKTPPTTDEEGPKKTGEESPTPPAPDKAAPDKPATDTPSTDKPAVDKPAADKPAEEKP